MCNGDDKSGAEGGTPPTQEQANPSPRILVVDDESYMCDLMVQTLAHFGHKNVDIARDGAEAWKALHATSYRLVITDHKMPKVTGVELIRKMRSENMLLPVILMSGTMPTDELERNPGLRVEATLCKPFATAELLAIIRRVLPTTDGPAAMKEEPSLPPETQAMAPARGQKTPPCRILVVDDDRDARELNIDVLLTSGYEVDGVKDGMAGWEALQAASYDLVITDNRMPRMTGLEMIEKLNSARMAIPIIMATGNLPTEEFASRPWLKPDVMLQKPFTSRVLLDTVRNVLGPDDGNQDMKETPGW